MKTIVVLTGAGMSGESGIKTFREMGGLWEQHDVTEVASPMAWESNPQLVLDFYNQRRKQLFESEPNEGHRLLTKLESKYQVNIVTQNVDDLHERAGCKNVLHLHGELKKVRSTIDPNLIYKMDEWELKLGDVCEKGSQLRPHIVWFGESVTEISNAALIVQQTDILIVIGTSLNVYPAAGLLDYTKPGTPIYLIDPGSPAYSSSLNVHHIREKASKGVSLLLNELL